jgi:DNA-binding transcriptional regulator YhcF (GntR family)
MIDLDHKSHVPLYLQIVHQARALITRGALSVGVVIKAQLVTVKKQRGLRRAEGHQALV